MKKIIPNFLSNLRSQVYNSTYKNNDLIIGDTEKILDIENQYLIQSCLNTNDFINAPKKINKIKNISCAKITGEEHDNFTDFTIYPAIDIKIKGSGIKDMLQKNNHLPTGFFCIHNSTEIHRRHFGIYENFFNFTKKKYLIKSINIISKSICFFPMFSEKFRNPFEDYSTKNKIKPFKKFDQEKIKIFQKELIKIKKQKNKKNQSNQIIKFIVDNGVYEIYNPEHNGDKLIFVLKK